MSGDIASRTFGSRVALSGVLLLETILSGNLLSDSLSSGTVFQTRPS